ncbi:MAG TPA: molybdenum cofactor guanylyltransferase [Bacillota bacterium]|jgi:molybdopterin-guanine dinucleotide biosynthesis protein A|nr:molybdenum cofactor guanylyltransferase [Bacillota bacterium]HOB86525.1 molybdenum cofactor guanylyltransferase [Bacillota bacterium]HOP68902.1 molybdenum cofactor guanylyltransferase [Bacillota bacterium]HPT33409.1 molybdenum cofactor guanylyltransferase [Bacillota bacterium]HPZ64061.1 molybdenum cofactor guanylyltransferase [Bacillota bacterium]
MSPGEDRGVIILAGGDSKRLGCPKPILPLAGVPLIKRIIHRLESYFNVITVITDRRELFQGLPVKIGGDLLIGYKKSPLRGIHAGLTMSPLPYQFVIACDMPFVNLELVKRMAVYAPHYDVVVPRINDQYEPLHAYYSRDCAQVIEKALAAGSFKVIDFYSRLKVKEIGLEEILSVDPRRESFFNINTWEDYQRAENMLAVTGGERNV